MIFIRQNKIYETVDSATTEEFWKIEFGDHSDMVLRMPDGPFVKEYPKNKRTVPAKDCKKITEGIDAEATHQLHLSVQDSQDQELPLSDNGPISLFLVKNFKIVKFNGVKPFFVMKFDNTCFLPHQSSKFVVVAKIENRSTNEVTLYKKEVSFRVRCNNFFALSFLVQNQCYRRRNREIYR